MSIAVGGAMSNVLVAAKVEEFQIGGKNDERNKCTNVLYAMTE